MCEVIPIFGRRAVVPPLLAASDDLTLDIPTPRMFPPRPLEMGCHLPDAIPAERPGVSLGVRAWAYTAVGGFWFSAAIVVGSFFWHAVQ